VKIYNYHPQTHEFLSDRDARPDPVVPNEFEIPAHATPIAPPQAGTNEVAIFDPASSTWTLQPDYRGTKRYSTIDGSEQEIKDIGPLDEVTPKNTTDEPLPTPPEGKRTVWDGEASAWTFVDLPPPESVSMRQARLALLSAGLLDTVEAAIAALDGAEGKAARIEWEFATEVRRDNALFEALAEQLSLTSGDLDSLFRQAAAL
jgi:hypothetical protein